MANVIATTSEDDARPGPFLKWAGGKGQLLSAIIERLPATIGGAYVEPFVGGGAVFFELAAQRRCKRARLFDANAELVDCYRAVRDEVDAVIAALGTHTNDAEHFYAVRAIDPQTLPRPARAARTIFLNRVGFNGLYRVNASGNFNVPFGRNPNAKICNEKVLRAASHALALAEIEVADFDAACAPCTAGDVVYLDPPYVPLSKTSSFTSYATGKFGDEEHVRLAAAFAGLVDRGAYVLLSNSDTPRTRELYAGWKVTTVEANRAINSKAEKRGAITEILVQGMRL